MCADKRPSRALLLGMKNLSDFSAAFSALITMAIIEPYCSQDKQAQLTF